MGVVALCTIVLLHPWTVTDWRVFAVRWKDSGPITFYGRVVDESGAPVANASTEVVFSRLNLFWINGETQIRRVPMSLTTDSAGRFSFQNVRAVGFTVKDIRKPGYVWDNTALKYRSNVSVSFGRRDVAPPRVGSSRSRPKVYQMVLMARVEDFVREYREAQRR